MGAPGKASSWSHLEVPVKAGIQKISLPSNAALDMPP